MFRRSWVRIPAPYDGCNIFSHICCKNCNVSLGGTKITEKRPGMAHLKTRYVVKRLMGPGPE